MLELEPQSYADGATSQQGSREAAAAAMQALQSQQQQQPQQSQQEGEQQKQALLNAQARLAQLPPPPPVDVARTPNATSLSAPPATLGGLPVQTGSFFVPRGHTAVTAAPGGSVPSTASQSPRPALLPRSQPPAGVNLSQQPRLRTGSNASSQEVVVASTPQAVGDLSNRLSEVSSLLRGFATPAQTVAQPAEHTPSSTSAALDRLSAAAAAAAARRSTTPTSVQIGRPTAENTHSTSAGSGPVATGRANLLRIPVPFQSAPTSQASQQEGSEAGSPGPPEQRALPPAVVVPARYRNHISSSRTDGALSIDTTTSVGSSGPPSARSGGPVSAATFLSSLKKPESAPVSSQNQQQQLQGTFSPSPIVHGGEGGSIGSTSSKGKFSNPHSFASQLS